jgi:hypothetical protein
MALSSSVRRPRWYAIPGRILLVTFLMTLLSFALTLFVSICWLVVSGWLHGTSPDMRFAYRHLALPAAMVSGAIVLVIVVVLEARHYRQAKALAGIARASRSDAPVRQIGS